MEGTGVPHALPFAFWQPQDQNDAENEIEDNMQPELMIERIDTCLEENGVNHRTERFESMSASAIKTGSSQLVVRRGQEFQLKLICNRPINPITDAVSLVLAVDPIAGEWISHGHGTVVYMLLQTGDHLEEDHDCDWCAKLLSTTVNEDNATELLVAVNTSPNASVSKWTLTINIKSRGSEESHIYQMDKPFYLLFNPWCEEDPVYLENEDQRQEYVLEDMTMIWKGNERSFRGRKWKVGQYEKNILDLTFSLLGDVARVSATYRGNPIRVCRALSGVVNSNDDYGVVVGKWNQDYDDGTAPSAWTGSVKILQEYFETQSPVRYGQCWVFAGVLTTLCRALGIPCRIITNFLSAHDTEASLTVDIYMDEEGNGVDYEYFSQEDYSLRKPDVQLQISGAPVVQSTVKVTASFHNPLPIPINGGTLQIECSGLAKTLTIPIVSVAASGECVVVFMISPSFKGNNKLSAKFQSNELSDIEGYVDFEVEDREEDTNLNEVLFFS
uniref:Transglutaminase-like domain-containing protein n=1 Tax=Anopheles minimus TaxID=112268 RepID=A0A182WGY9_9DIPT